MLDSPGHQAKQRDRALGALCGLAIGDALGMPVQGFEPARAVEVLGAPPDFREPPSDQLIARGLRAGSVTDDTLQCLIVGRLLIEGGGHISARALAAALVEWEREMQARGLADLLGPSTRRAVAAVVAGEDPITTGRTGTTNGAAMRITPVGVATPLHRLIEAVMEADRVTHDTRIAHAGAIVVATVVSAGVDGQDFRDAAELAVQAAGQFGFGKLFTQAAIGATGVETAESVPTALAVARAHADDVWAACCTAAALGGDADTIAAMAGAMVGACNGLASLPVRAVALVRGVNALDFEPLVDGLLGLRNR